MDWKDYSSILKDLLGLEGSPVAITYSMKPAEEGDDQRYAVCEALIAAQHGEVINISKDNSGCPGGLWHLGLTPPPKGDMDKLLKEFLVNGEKLFCSIATFHRTMALTASPPEGLAEYVVMSPLEKAEFMPDLVVFHCNPEQGCRLVTLATYPTGQPPRIEMAGSTCHMVIAYPLVSGELNVSLMDYTERKTRLHKADDLYVSIPYHLMPGLIWSIDRCGAGTASMHAFPSSPSGAGQKSGPSEAKAAPKASGKKGERSKGRE